MVSRIDGGASVDMSVTGSNGIRSRLRKEYQRQIGSGGWRAVGEVFGISGGMAYRVALQGYEPKDSEIRRKLGMAALEEVEVIGEDLQRGAQVLRSDVCVKCGQPFVSNHPRRGKCIRCSPYKGTRGVKGFK